VPLLPCIRCGKTDPRRMIGLMTLWFGPFVDIRPDHGYFHLCPACYHERVKPHLDKVQGRLAELHPLTHQLGLHRDEEESGEDAEPSVGQDSEPDLQPGPDPEPDPEPDLSAAQESEPAVRPDPVPAGGVSGIGSRTRGGAASRDSASKGGAAAGRDRRSA
jgi:hypothetical protein